MPWDDGFIPWQTAPRSSLGTNPSSIYKEVRQVGKGTYGDVYFGSNTVTNETVALKKVSWRHVDEKHKRKGFPLNALREIRLLKIKCSHPNLVRLLDVAAHVPGALKEKKKNNQQDEWEEEGAEGFVYLVFEYVDHDLAGIIDAFRATNRFFSVPAVKCLIKQLLDALVYIHSQNICHRDLKCSNLLITKDHQLKLADFGLARELNNEGLLSPRVVTLWYRAPELLLGDTRYSLAVDIWSVGCILIELLRMSPIFPGKEELDQLKRIFLVCGYPDATNWPSYADMPLAKNLTKLESVPRSSSIPYAEADGVEHYCAMKQLDPDGGHLAARMLALDPARRCSAVQALNFKFLMDAPPPQSLPPFEAEASFHEWETKKARKEAAAKEADEIRSQAASSESVKDAKPAAEAAEALAVKAGKESPSHASSREEDKSSRRDRKRDSSPSGKRRRDRSLSPDSRSRARRSSRRSRSPQRREKTKDRKSKKHNRRSRSPGRRRRG